MRNRGGRFLIKSVNRHDGLLLDSLLGETSFKGFDLEKDDALLFRLGSSFAYGLDKVKELLGSAEAALRAHRELLADSLELLH
ncbi:hypothetical protein ACFX1X_020433 [Malus domestica]